MRKPLLILLAIAAMMLSQIALADTTTSTTDPNAVIDYSSTTTDTSGTDSTLTVDPAYLHIGTGVNTTCAAGANTGCGADPVQLTSNSHADIFVQSGSQSHPIGANQQHPLLLIIGVPTTSSNPTPLGNVNPVSSVTFYNSCDSTGQCTGSGVTGGTTWAAGAYLDPNQPFYTQPHTYVYQGFGAAYKASPSNGNNMDAYQWLELLGGGQCNSSNNPSNWFGADSTLAPNAQSFTIYTIALFYNDTTSSVVGNNVVDLTFNPQLPGGSYLISYGRYFGTSGTSWTANPNPYTTAWTNTGQTPGGPPQVPEPASIVLFGSGLAGIAGLLRRLKK